MAISSRPAVEMRKRLTPDDVRRLSLDGCLDSEAFYELIDGELIALPPAMPDHARRGANILGPLWVFARQAGGQVFDSSAGFMVGADLSELRSPDASYVAPGRAQESYQDWFRGAPDLAVEVLSQEQYNEAYARTKVREYLDAGAQLVWLVDSRRQEVRVYRPGANEIAILRDEASLTLEPIIAGFSLKVADIFG